MSADSTKAPVQYLGDGVYAALERGMIRLTTGAHEGPEVTNTVFLEPEVFRALEKFAEKIGWSCD